MKTCPCQSKGADGTFNHTTFNHIGTTLDFYENPLKRSYYICDNHLSLYQAYPKDFKIEPIEQKVNMNLTSDQVNAPLQYKTCPGHHNNGPCNVVHNFILWMGYNKSVANGWTKFPVCDNHIGVYTVGSSPLPQATIVPMGSDDLKKYNQKLTAPMNIDIGTFDWTNNVQNNYIQKAPTPNNIWSKPKKTEPVIKIHNHGNCPGGVFQEHSKDLYEVFYTSPYDHNDITKMTVCSSHLKSYSKEKSGYKIGNQINEKGEVMPIVTKEKVYINGELKMWHLITRDRNKAMHYMTVGVTVEEAKKNIKKYIEYTNGPQHASEVIQFAAVNEVMAKPYLPNNGPVLLVTESE